ncbi:hypothetical protein HQ531_12175 [bacterium]|nr:hypothetical protein [bacterium]
MKRELIELTEKHPRCFHCGSLKVNKLGDGRLKCQSCEKKYSNKRLLDDVDILIAFSKQLPPMQVATDMNKSYATIHKRYKEYRLMIAESSYPGIESFLTPAGFQESFFGEQGIINRRRDHQGFELTIGILSSMTNIYTSVVYNVNPKNILRELENMNAYGMVMHYPNFKSIRGRRIMWYNFQNPKIKAYDEFPMHSWPTFFWTIFLIDHQHIPRLKRENIFLYLKEHEFRMNHPDDYILKPLWELRFKHKYFSELFKQQIIRIGFEDATKS